MPIPPTYREGDPKVWSTMPDTALGSWRKPVPCGHSLVIREFPKVWSTVLVTALGIWGKLVPLCHSLVIRKYPKRESTVLVTALDSLGKLVPRCHSLVIREGYPKGWSTVLVTALGSWGKPVPRGHSLVTREDSSAWSTVPVTTLGTAEGDRSPADILCRTVRDTVLINILRPLIKGNISAIIDSWRTHAEHPTRMHALTQCVFVTSRDHP
jgi:hypothetical protein